MFFGSLHHSVKEYINILPPKISEQRFKFACPKLQEDVNKAKGTGREMEEARGIAKRSSMERDCTVAQGSVRTFYVMFLSWGPLLLWVLGKLVIEDKLTYCGVLALLLQEFEMSKRTALILVVIVVVNNIILIIMLVWEGLGTS